MNKRRFTLIFSLITTSLFSFQNEMNRFSKASEKEVEILLENFMTLTEKLPTYHTYYPGVYLMNKNGALNLSMITEVESPNNIESARKTLSKILKQDKSTQGVKIIALTFLEEIRHPKNNINIQVVAIYVEHNNETSGMVYYYPYIKTKDKIEF